MGLNVPLQCNLSQSQGNPVVKGGYYCIYKTVLNDAVAPLPSPTPCFSAFPWSATQACLFQSRLRKDFHFFPNPKKVEQKPGGTEGWAD